ncbi:AAA family ATPase [Ruegeria arenilitoris]|uniref:AAA family ATPase n=1 Tax=Ruegeria arenilitoris TaxID=1173585 RepID=UPI00147D9AC4|nr:adenylate/guanylate cyclase domain-containing protein [Ruegeria arenilitoris]
MTDIAAFLEKLGLSKYAPAFAAAEVALSDLVHLSEHDLIDLGLPLGPRRRLIAATARFAQDTAGDAVHTRRQGKIVAERRQLTVMFVDLVGSTAMSERLDPEDLGELVRRFKETCTTAVSKFGGHIACFMGDGAMIYFGYPHAQEDAASRAIEAGLQILDELPAIDRKEELQARIGIATGLVVVGTIYGDGLRENDVVMGRTPNLAARLQGLAEPNSLIISPSTRRLIGGAFRLKDAGRHVLKGFADEIQAWTVEGAARIERRFEINPEAGSGRLIGRGSEFRKLCDKWNEASHGAGQSVLISGEAGIGKSRLIEGLAHELQGQDILRLNFQCSPLHSSSALYPIVQQLERSAGFAPADTDAQKLDKLLPLLRYLTSEQQRLIADLLSIDADDALGPLDLPPQVKLEKTLEAVTQQLVSMARSKPVLLLFEDAHWVDPTTLSLTDRVIERIRDLPVLIVVTARQGFDPSWGHHHNTLHIPLTRLSNAEVAEIVTDVAGGKSLPGPVCDLIAAKTDGIPLFVQEVTRGLLESGQLRLTEDGYVLRGPLPSLSVPSTLKDSLMERLDRLGMAKDVAQTGAVFGRRFSVALVAAVSMLPAASMQASLEQLAMAGIIQRPPDGAEDEYLFRHALIRDMAYDSLLRSERQVLHDQAAGVLLDQQPYLAQTQPEVLAQHYTLANRPEEAVTHWQNAGQRAIERSALSEALTHLSKALGLVSELPKSHDRDLREIDLQVLRAGVLRSTDGIAGEATGEAYGRLRELCRRARETERLFPVLNGLYAFHLVRAEYRLAGEVADQILDLAEVSGRTEHRMVGHRAMGAVQLHIGNLTDARAHLEQAWTLYDFKTHGKLAYVYGTDHAAITAGFLGVCYSLMGEPARAQKVQAQALDWANELQHAHSVAQVLTYTCMVHLLHRDIDALIATVAPLEETSREHRLAFMSITARMWLSWARAHRTPDAEHIAALRQASDDWWSSGAGNYKSFFLSLIAELLVRAGGLKAAKQALTQAELWRKDTDEGWADAEVFRVRSLLDDHERKDPEPMLKQAVSEARKCGASLFELRAAVELTRCVSKTGGRPGPLLSDALDRFDPKADIPELLEARALLETIS